MTISRYGLIVSLCLSLSFTASAQPPDIPEGDPKPYDSYPFVVPGALKSLVGDYRETFHRVSAIDFSTLHWNHFVTIFTKGGAADYRANFIEYLTFVEMEEEDEEYDAHYEQYPIGTVFVKEHYLSTDGRPGIPTQLSVMIKHAPGYDSEHGDWEYIQAGIDGDIMLQGNANDPGVMTMCAGCHMNIAERDYIFALNYRESHSERR